MPSFPKQFDRDTPIRPPLAAALATALGVKIPADGNAEAAPPAGAALFHRDTRPPAPKAAERILPTGGEKQKPPDKPKQKPPDRPPDSPKVKIIEPDYLLWQRSYSSGPAVKIGLVTGETVEGRVVTFGIYSVSVKTDTGRLVVVFKGSMTTAEEVGR